MLSALCSLRRQSPEVRRHALAATLLLPRAAQMVARHPFPETVSFGAVPLGTPVPTDVSGLSRAVAAVARRLPVRALCFEQGLTVQRLLRKRGLPAVLHYGVAGGGELSAHVWVSLDGEIVHGGETAAGYAEVGRWP